jgi:hypothetical protein
MRRYGHRRSRYRNNWNQAAHHISAAKRFTAEVGGFDQDVKDYFFSLSGTDLQKVLASYEDKYGTSARNYAENTISSWRSKKVTMSGMVAERLFHFLPRHMNPAKKYELIEGMWKHFGPSSKKMLRVGKQANLEDVIEEIRKHIDSVVADYQIPEALEQRFQWLSQNDALVKQKILNHLRNQERLLVVGGARSQIGLLMTKQAEDTAGLISRMTHVFNIGKHELHVIFDPKKQGVEVEDYRYLPPTSSGPGVGSFIVGALVILVLFLIFRR